LWGWTVFCRTALYPLAGCLHAALGKAYAVGGTAEQERK